MTHYKKPMKKFIVSAILLFLLLLLLAAAKYHHGFFDSYQQFSRSFMGNYGKITSYIPFSITEASLILLIFGICILLISFFIQLIRTSANSIHSRLFLLVNGISSVLLFFSATLFFFLATWGLNYFAPPLEEQLALDTSDLTEDELYSVTREVVLLLNDLGKKTTRGSSLVSEFGSFSYMSSLIEKSGITFSYKYPQYKSVYSEVKDVYFSDAMSYLGITGMFFPFTAEANVSHDNIDASLPFTMAHEMSHRLAVAREDEANFTAYLICRNSSYMEVQYSGYYNAWLYCGNELYGQNPDRYQELRNLLSPEVLADLGADQTLYEKYDTPVREAGTKMNDTYLTAMQQQEGVKSYDRVVRLIIAQWRQDHKLK